MKNIRQKRQCGGGSLMMWGVLMPNGLIALKKQDGRQSSEKYINLLDTFAVPLLKLNMKSNFYLIQDNCSIHVSRIAKDYFDKQSFKALDWPAKSPDLNLMENIWKLISDLVYSEEQPKNISELEHKIHAAVLQINSERLAINKGLYTSYRKRLTKVLLSKGNIV